jgi:hypothetical protein
VGAATTTLRIRRIGTLGNVPTLEPAVGLFVDWRVQPTLVSCSGSARHRPRRDPGRAAEHAVRQERQRRRRGALHARAAGAPQAWGEITGGAFDIAHSPGIFDMKAGVGGPLSRQ